jgi:hypothetical protein
MSPVGRDFSGFADVEGVRELQFVDLPRGRNHVASTEGVDLGVGGSQHLHLGLERHRGRELFVAQGALHLEVHDAVGAVHRHGRRLGFEAVERERVVDDDVAEAGPPLGHDRLQHQPALDGETLSHLALLAQTHHLVELLALAHQLRPQLHTVQNKAAALRLLSGTKP